MMRRGLYQVDTCRAAMGRALRMTGLALCAALLGGCVAIGPGKVGVLWKGSGGTQREVFGEGRHPLASWNRVYIYDLRKMNHDENLNILAADGVSLTLNTGVRYQIIPHEVVALHEQIGPDYYAKIVKPLLISVVKSVVSHFTPEEIYATRRGVIEEQSLEALRNQLAPQHIAVDAVLVRNVVLPPLVQQEINQKMVEAEKVQRMRYVLEVTKAQAEQHRIEAQGIADFNRTVAPSLNNQVLEFQRTQLLASVATSNNAKTVVVGTGAHGAPVVVAPGEH